MKTDKNIDEDPFEEFSNLLDEEENRERIEKGFPPLPKYSNDAPETRAGKIIAGIYTYGLKFGIYAFIISIIAMFATAFLPLELEERNRLFGLFGGFGTVALLLAFFGLNGIPAFILFLGAAVRFWKEEPKTKIGFYRLLFGGILGISFTCFFVVILIFVVKHFTN